MSRWPASAALGVDAVFAPPGSTVEVKFSSLGQVTIEGGEDPGKGDS